MALTDAQREYMDYVTAKEMQRQEKERLEQEELRKQQTRLASRYAEQGLYDPRTNRFVFNDAIQYDPNTGQTFIVNPEDSTQNLFGYDPNAGQTGRTFFGDPQEGGVTLRGRYDPRVYQQLTEADYAGAQSAFDKFVSEQDALFGSYSDAIESGQIRSGSEAMWKGDRAQDLAKAKEKEFFGQYYDPRDIQGSIDRYMLANAYQTGAERLGLTDSNEYYSSLSQQASQLTEQANQPLSQDAQRAKLEELTYNVENNPRFSDAVKDAILSKAYEDAGMTYGTPEPQTEKIDASDPRSPYFLGGRSTSHELAKNPIEQAYTSRQTASTPKPVQPQQTPEPVQETPQEGPVTTPEAQQQFQANWDNFFKQARSFLEPYFQQQKPSFNLTSGFNTSRQRTAPMTGQIGTTVFQQPAYGGTPTGSTYSTK